MAVAKMQQPCFFIMSFKKDLAKQIEGYILFPDYLIEAVINEKCLILALLEQKQKADICAIRRNACTSANKFMYSLDELDLIIKTVDSDPTSSFARLRDAIRQIEFILDEK